MPPYSDLARPPLRADDVSRALLTDGGLWTTVEVVEETGSTNTDLAAAARAGSPEGAVLVAEYQNAGRGRSDRTWTSPPRAGLAVSVLLRPGVETRDWSAVPQKRWGWVPLIAGLALVESVTRLCPVSSSLKWPNDLLVEELKCGGILSEVVDGAVVLGIGLNVTLREDELPPAPPWSTSPTSLWLAGSTVVDRAALLEAVLAEMSQWYRQWRSVGGDADACGLRPAYLRHCATVGRRVRALLPGGGELVGTAVAVDGDGRLELRRPDGDTRAIAAGDILHVRGFADRG